jgi:hypothetical protein
LRRVDNAFLLRFAGLCVLAGVAMAMPTFAAGEEDHKAEEPETSSVSSKNTGAPRSEVLTQGMKRAGLGVPALRAIEQAFRINPQIETRDFDKVVSELSQDKAVLNESQAQELKRLYRDALSGVKSNAGKEVSDAARKVLGEVEQQTATANPRAARDAAPSASRTALPDPALNAFKAPDTQQKNALSPDAVNALLQGLGAQLGKAAPAQEVGAADDLLSENGVLSLVQNLLGKDKEKESAGPEKSDIASNRPPGPPPFANRPTPPGNDSDRDRRKDEHNRLLDAAAKRDRGRGIGAFASPPSSNNNENKKEADQKKQEAPSNAAFTPKRKKEEDPEPTPPASEKSAGDSSILDSLNAFGPPAPPPSKSPLQPIEGASFGPDSASAAGAQGAPGAAGANGAFPAGPMMGGGGGGGGGSLSSGGPLDGGDVFGGVGMDTSGANMEPGRGGYPMVKDPGYAVGGGEVGGIEPSLASDLGSDMDLDVYTPVSSSQNRIPSYYEQVIASEEEATAQGASMVERFVGFTRKSLCASEQAKRDIGLCAARDLQKKRAEWSRRLQESE